MRWQTDRRAVLKGLGGLALTPWASCSPTSSRPIAEAIDTVVVLMMENRSFDHYLGALTFEGRSDVAGLSADMSNPDRSGRPVLVHPSDRDCVLDPQTSKYFQTPKYLQTT